MKKSGFFLAAAVALLVLASCSSLPRAPNYSSLDDSQDMRFVGEWKFSIYSYVLNADGTGVQEYVSNDGEREVVANINWRTTETWFSMVFIGTSLRNSTQLTRPYAFSDDGQTVTFEDARQINRYKSRAATWTKASGD